MCKYSSPRFDSSILSQNIAVHMHLTGHDIIKEDMIKLLDYFDYHEYGKTPQSTDLNLLSTSVFDLPCNYDPIFDHFAAGWQVSN